MLTPTIYLVDDDASFRRAATRLLAALGFSVRGFASASEFLTALPELGPGCVILDLQMPGMSGLQLQEALAREKDPLPVVFLTGQGEIPDSVRAMRHGAEDFLTKSAPKEELLAAIQRALDRDAREREERTRQRAVRARLETLTDREREVLGHVVQGKLNKQIAGDLGIHERTVKLHRTTLTNKLGVQSVAELTRLWLEAGQESARPTPSDRG